MSSSFPTDVMRNVTTAERLSNKSNVFDSALGLFSRKTRVDGRWALGAALVLYFVVLFFPHSDHPYSWVWRRMGVPVMVPSFADLRNITAAVDSYRDGYNPLVNNPHDPWARPMNYPRLWLGLFSALGIHQENTAALGVCFATAFFLAIFLLAGTINAYEGGFYGLLACSPAAMLAVERGNNDLIVFTLLTLALLALRRFGAIRWLCYVFIGFCSMLKLYPFCAYVLALRERPRHTLIILFIASTAFALFLFIIGNDLKAINAVLPRIYYSSYGSHVLFDRIAAEYVPLHAYVTSTVVCLVVIAGAYSARCRTPMPELSSRNSESLMLGAVLYTATFAAGNNFNYRLIMLLFAVPALLQLVKKSGWYTRFAGFMLAAIAAALWAAPVAMPLLFLVKEIANWILFGGLCFLLFHLLPQPSIVRFCRRNSVVAAQ